MWAISLLRVQDVIANVPPHWNEGLIEDEGSRWAGQVRLGGLGEGP